MHTHRSLSQFILAVLLTPTIALAALAISAPSSVAQETKGRKASVIAGLCRNLQPQLMLTGHLSPVMAMAVSGDSKTLVSGDQNGVVNVWSLETGQLLHTLAAYPGAVKAVVITPDGKSIVSANLLGERYENNGIAIKVWNLQTGELIQSGTKQQGIVQTLDSPETQTIIRVGEIDKENSDDIKIEFLNRMNGNSLQAIPVEVNKDSSSTQHPSKKITATVSVRGLDGGISFITLQDLTIKKSPCTLPKLGQVNRMIFSPDSQRLIIAGRRIEVIKLDSIIPISERDRSNFQSRILHLNRLGQDKLKRNQYYSAERHFWEAFELNRQLDNEAGQIDAIYNIAEAKYTLCQVAWNSCRTDYQGLYKLLFPYFQAKGDRDRAMITVQRSKPQEKSRDDKREYYQQALKKYQSLRNLKLEADTLIKIALVDRDPRKRESLLKQVLGMYRTLGDRRGEVEVLHALGLLYSRILADENYNPVGLRTFDAVAYLQTAAKLSREIDDRFLESSILLDLGDAYRWSRQYSQALASYQLSLDIRRRLGDSTVEDILLYRKAQTFRNLGQYQLALETYQKTLSVCSLKEDECLASGREYPLFGMDIFEEMGEIYFALKQYPKALDSFYQNKKSYGWSWKDNKNLGLTYEKLGQIDLALKYFNEILRDKGPMCGDADTADATIVEAIRQDSGKGNDGSECQGYRETWISSLSVATFHSGEIYRRRGQYDQAIEMYKNSLARFSGNRATLLNNLGTLYKAQGDYKQALKIYQEALWIRRGGQRYRFGIDTREKDVYGEAVSLNNIGEIYRRQGQYSKSLETYQQSLEIFRNLIRSLTVAQATITPFQDIATMRQGEASVLHNFGSVYYDLGQYDKALNFYNQSLDISKALDNKEAQGRSLNNIGLTYEAQKQYARALEIYQQALIARREAEDLPGEASTLNNIGLAHTKMNQPRQGVEPIQQALVIFQKLEDRASEANTLDSLGTLYTALGQYDQSWSSYQHALRLVKEVNLPPLERTIFTNIGNLLAKNQQPELAIVFYKQSVNLTETIRGELRSLPKEQQESYTQTVIGTYRNLADLLIQQGRLPEAHAVLELLKLQELREFTRSADIKPTGIDSPGISLAKIEETALNQILKQFTTLGKFGQEIDKCEVKQCPELKQIKDQRTALNMELDRELAKIRVALANHYATQPSTLNPGKLNEEASRIVNAQPGTVLIYPLVLKDKIQFLLAVKAGNGGVTFRPFETKVTAEQLFNTIKTFRDQLGETTIAGTPKADLATVQATSQQLYTWLIKPLEPELKGMKHLVFAPDLTTRYVPLAALYDGNQYLIQRFALSTITAASETDTEARVPRPTGDQPLLLAMGASTFQNLNPLTNVPAELDAITKTKEPKDTQGIYPGSEFLNTSFDYETLQTSLEKGTYRILHLATHGAIVKGRPENSYLVPGRGQNLTTELIDQLRNSGLRNIHLVVLSACETAVGDRASDGMEIPGISYYFLKNKVKSVMASLWNVNDASTALIMQQFYIHIGNGMTKAEALQQVQRDLINGKFTANDAPTRSDILVTSTRTPRPANFSHPYYWAPFILIGNSL